MNNICLDELKSHAQCIADNMGLDLDIDVILNSDIDGDALIQYSKSVKIFLNPKSRLHKERSGMMESLEHELGHLYMMTRHPKIRLLFKHMCKPSFLIENVFRFNGVLRSLSTSLVCVIIVLLPLLSSHMGFHNFWAGFIGIGLGIYLTIPYCIEEYLASHFGWKYRKIRKGFLVTKR